MMMNVGNVTRKVTGQTCADLDKEREVILVTDIEEDQTHVIVGEITRDAVDHVV